MKKVQKVPTKLICTRYTKKREVFKDKLNYQIGKGKKKHRVLVILYNWTAVTIKKINFLFN